MEIDVGQMDTVSHKELGDQPSIYTHAARHHPQSTAAVIHLPSFHPSQTIAILPKKATEWLLGVGFAQQAQLVPR
jgi:hypothetical protein